jgi:hypothetical protein
VDKRRVPQLDEGVRRRLTVRFGDDARPWLDAVPAALAEVADRWRIELGSLIPRGTMSVVVRCRTSDGGAAVLKASPDRERLTREAAALRSWAMPQFLPCSDSTPPPERCSWRPSSTILAESETYPSPAAVGRLLTALHRVPAPISSTRPCGR